MRNEIKQIISTSVVTLLKPLVRILLKHGVPYGTFIDLAKWTYVDVALNEFGIEGKKQSTSRVSIITGLSRKEVKRMKEMKEFSDLGTVDRYNRAARVIGGWLKDKRFLDEREDPRELPFEGEEKSFSSLVKAYSGDVPHRAVLDEMLNAGVVEVRDGMIKLLTRGYIVKKGEIEKLSILGTDVSELIATIKHNIECGPSEAFLQRKTSYDNIPDDALIELRMMALRMGEDFIEMADKIISKYDRDVNPSIKGEGRKKAGLGIFYFE